MAENPLKNFIYLNWRPSQNPNHRFNTDSRCSVEITTSSGPYKNTYAELVMEKNNIYYWEIRILQGSYFKIGIIKEQAIKQPNKKAFSDCTDGFALFSTGKLRNGSNSTGTDFNSGFGPGDVVKVEFNSKVGTLKFGKNNEPMKLAFSDANFKKGGYVPAVAALIEGSKYCLSNPVLQD